MKSPLEPVVRPQSLTLAPRGRGTSPSIMNKIYLLLCAIVVILGIASSQTKAMVTPELPPLPAEGSMNALIVSSSGQARRLTGFNGYVGRAGLRPRQAVRVTLVCPVSLKGQPISVFSPGGGGPVSPNDARTVHLDGTASFVFQAAANHGLYRVFVQAGAQQNLIEFYVLDLEHPSNNPPRVRIVD
jgi:hypothetical protein